MDTEIIKYEIDVKRIIHNIVINKKLTHYEYEYDFYDWNEIPNHEIEINNNIYKIKIRLPIYINKNDIQYSIMPKKYKLITIKELDEYREQLKHYNHKNIQKESIDKLENYIINIDDVIAIIKKFIIKNTFNMKQEHINEKKRYDKNNNCNTGIFTNIMNENNIFELINNFNVSEKEKILNNKEHWINDIYDLNNMKNKNFEHKMNKKYDELNKNFLMKKIYLFSLNILYNQLCMYKEYYTSCKNKIIEDPVNTYYKLNYATNEQSVYIFDSPHEFFNIFKDNFIYKKNTDELLYSKIIIVKDYNAPNKVNNMGIKHMSNNWTLAKSKSDNKWNLFPAFNDLFTNHPEILI